MTPLSPTIPYLARPQWREALAVIGIAVVYAALTAVGLLRFGGGDFIPHIRWASMIAEQGIWATSHPLYQFIVIAVHVVLPGGSWLLAGMLASIAIAVLTPAAAYLVLRPAFDQPRVWRSSSPLWVLLPC